MDKKPEECKGGAPEWMVTYGDLVTLLMCFFVLLFAFSEIDAQKFEAVMQSFSGSAGILESGKALSEDQLVFDASPENTVTPEAINAEKQERIKEQLEAALQELEQAFEGEEFGADIEVEISENRLIIRLTNNVLFDSASADIKPEALNILETIGEILKGELFTTSTFEIEGHTDNVPINTERYPSNWHLSSARSASVIQYFHEGLGFEYERFKIGAYGEYKPIDTNTTASGRANNRRVEIIIEQFNFSDLDTIGEENTDVDQDSQDQSTPDESQPAQDEEEGDI